MTKNLNNNREIEDAAPRQSDPVEEAKQDGAGASENSSPVPAPSLDRSERVVAALARYEARPKRPTWWGRR